MRSLFGMTDTELHRMAELAQMRRFWQVLPVVLVLLAGIAVGLGVTWWRMALQEPVKAESESGLLIREGEWVTRPNGERVCQISRNIYRLSPLPTAFLRSSCREWQISIPPVGSPVDAGQFDWLEVSARGRQRLHVGDRWVP